MEYIISIFAIGFLVAALPGAVQATILQHSIVGKIKSSIKFALGAAFMDGLYIGLAYYGLIQMLVSYDWLKLMIGILGSIYMAYIGIQGLKDSFKNKDIKEIKNKSFFGGLLLVLLHIPTLFYFISLATTIFKAKMSLSAVIFSGIALFFGAMTCFMMVALIGKIINKFGSDWLIKLLNILASSVLIIFAFKVIINLFYLL